MIKSVVSPVVTTGTVNESMRGKSGASDREDEIYLSTVERAYIDL